MKQMLGFVLGCALFSATQANAASDRQHAEQFEELTTYTQKQLEHLAERCVMINGEVWSLETLDDQEIMTKRLQLRMEEDQYSHRSLTGGGIRQGFVDPYALADAPICVRLSTVNDEDEAVFTRSTEDAGDLVVREAIGDVPGASARTGRVLQVLDSGLMMKTGDEDWYVEASTMGVAEDELLYGVFVEAGTFSYVTVLGSSRTIRRYEIIDLDVDLEPKSITARELFVFLREHDLDFFPVYRPQWKVDKRPSFTSRVTKRGNGIKYTSRDLDERGEYHWEWRMTKKPVNLYQPLNAD